MPKPSFTLGKSGARVSPASPKLAAKPFRSPSVKGPASRQVKGPA